MDFTVAQEKENKLYSRKELVLELSTQTTPSRRELVEELGKRFSSGYAVVNRVSHPFGSTRVQVFCSIYESEEAARNFEPASLLKRGIAEKPAGDAEAVIAPPVAEAKQPKAKPEQPKASAAEAKPQSEASATEAKQAA